MARRNDGTGKRYEFQIFDDEAGQGRAIYEAISSAQTQGLSAAEFIRQALWFFICEGQPTQPIEEHVKHETSTDAMATVLQELAALRFAVSQSIPSGTLPNKDQHRFEAPQSSSGAENNDYPDQTDTGASTGPIERDMGVSSSDGLDLSPRRQPGVRNPVSQSSSLPPVKEFDAKEITRQMLASIRNFSLPSEKGTRHGHP